MLFWGQVLAMIAVIPMGAILAEFARHEVLTRLFYYYLLRGEESYLLTLSRNEAFVHLLPLSIFGQL